ncbi:Uncharacterized protein TCM_032305 [Theobroma cacao]|uniref:Uncharacterized protein n=1 Tax=Theobroma cacao TaxID=3641 RepID=A0A061FAH3_THECC|nr:Uncharacterized protein TCM_032305 [Theobroma cacao]
MKMLQASQEKLKPPHNSENAINGVNNMNGIGEIGESIANALATTTNPFIFGNFTIVTASTTTQSFVTKEKLQKLLDHKSKSINFSKLNLKLPYPVSVAIK